MTLRSRARQLVLTGPRTVDGEHPMLQRVRWQFVMLCLVGAALATTSLSQLEVGGGRVPGYLVASAAMAAWAVGVFRTEGRVRLLDPLGPALVGTIGVVAGGADWAFGSMYLSLFFHSLYGNRSRVIAKAIGYVVAFEAVVALTEGPAAVLTNQLLSTLLAAVVMAWVMHTMASSLGRNDIIRARERVLIRASGALVAAEDPQAVAELAVEHVTELARDHGADLRVSLWRRDGNALVRLATEGTDPGLDRIELDDMPSPVVSAFLTRPVVVLSPAEMEACRIAAGLTDGFEHGVALGMSGGAEPTGVLIIETATPLDGDLVGALRRFVDEVALADRAQRHHRLLAGVLENSADGIVLVDEDDRLAFISPSMAEMIGRVLEPDEGIASLLEIGVGTECRPVVGVDEVVREPASLAVRCADGRRVGVEVTVRPVAGAGTVLNIRDVSEHRRLQAEITHRAFYDPITDLPNRALFYDRVEHALARAAREGTQVAVAMLDLDDFKAVNDRWGHLAGDDLLRHVADRIQATVRRSDTVARLGGDEFALLLEGSDHAEEAPTVLQAVLGAVRHPVDLAGNQVMVSASAGAALSTGGETADDLLGAADMAMYAAKSRGKDAVVTFRPELRDELEERRTLRDELVAGMDRGELVVHYQPIVAMPTQGVVGVEALVRWEHPTRGHLAPARFVPLAEETGLIVPLGRLVLETACRDLAAWTRSGAVDRRFQLHVNLSVCQLADDGIVRDVEAALERHDVAAEHLVLEVTETALAADPAVAEQTLRRLHRLGVAIAIDDFGTGYASFTYLRRFPVDKVKIDRSFVADLGSGVGDGTLARAIVDLARSLGLVTVAEGVEDESARGLLQGWGCGQAQGWLWSRALTADQLVVWLAASGETGARDGEAAVTSTPAHPAVSTTLPTLPGPANRS